VLSDVEKLQLDRQPESLVKLSKILTTMPQRQDRQQIGNVISKLFDVAASKMKDEGDKEVVESLRKYIAMVEEDLY
jgi:ribosomal protein L30E